MAHDIKLEARVAEVLKETKGIRVKKMFGGVCFMHRGNMVCGVDKSRLMVRVGPDQYQDVLKMKHAEVMDMTGRPMKGFIFVYSDGLKTKASLKKWIELGLNFTRTLKAK